MTEAAGRKLRTFMENEVPLKTPPNTAWSVKNWVENPPGIYILFFAAIAGVAFYMYFFENISPVGSVVRGIALGMFIFLVAIILLTMVLDLFSKGPGRWVTLSVEEFRRRYYSLPPNMREKVLEIRGSHPDAEFEIEALEFGWPKKLRPKFKDLILIKWQNAMGEPVLLSQEWGVTSPISAVL